MSPRAAAGILVVFCPRPAPGTWAAAMLRELALLTEVRLCGPGWPARDLAQVELEGARLLLELDAVAGSLARPAPVPGSALRRAAWLVETSRKPGLHRQAARESELVFHAHPAWARALGRSSTWLPLCADEAVFQPCEVERTCDLAFVGPDPWRAEPLIEVARRLGLVTSLVAPAGPQAKAEAAAVYARARAVFHRHSTEALDVRVLEAMAAGRVVLVDRRQNGLELLAEPGRHFLVYEDPSQLEAHLRELRADEGRRGALEREAARWARERGSAKVRAMELVLALEARFGPLRAEPARGEEARTPEVRAVEGTLGASGLPASPRAGRGARWLVLAGEEPPAVGLASYAERLGAGLQARGDAVTIVRLRRGMLPARPARLGQPALVEVELGPLPGAGTAENHFLLASARAQRIAGQLAREQGPFHCVLVEPSLGALVGPSVAARLGVPLVLALEDCEVARRGNHLTRDQLYRSELEHWAADRARLVLVPTAGVEADARRHYGLRALRVTGWPVAGSGAPAADAARLRARLGLPAEAALVRAPLLGSEEAVALALELGRRGQCALVLGAAEALLVDRSGARSLGSRPVAGPALGALARGTRCAVHVGREDLGAADVACLAPAFARADDARPEAVLGAIEAARSGARLEAWDQGALEELACLAASPPAAHDRSLAPVAALAGGGS